jgi:S1-C subfamily serine protease
VIGFPSNSELTLLSGQVSNLNEVGGKFAVTATLAPSLSGAPVFNKLGEVVGIVINGRSSSQGGVIIPIALAQSFFASAGADN